MTYKEFVRLVQLGVKPEEKKFYKGTAGEDLYHTAKFDYKGSCILIPVKEGIISDYCCSFEFKRAAHDNITANIFSNLDISLIGEDDIPYGINNSGVLFPASTKFRSIKMNGYTITDEDGKNFTTLDLNNYNDIHTEIKLKATNTKNSSDVKDLIITIDFKAYKVEGKIEGSYKDFFGDTITKVHDVNDCEEDIVAYFDNSKTDEKSGIISDISLTKTCTITEPIYITKVQTDDKGVLDLSEYDLRPLEAYLLANNKDGIFGDKYLEKLFGNADTANLTMKVSENTWSFLDSTKNN